MLRINFFSKQRSNRHTISRTVIFGALGTFAQFSGAYAGTEDDFTTGTDLSLSANYSTGLPTTSNDVLLTTTSAALTLNAFNLSIASLNVTDAVARTISDNESGSTGSTLTLGIASNVDSITGSSAADLIYVGNSAGNLTIQGANSGSGTGMLTLAVAVTGRFSVATGASLNISAQVTGGSSATIQKAGGGTLTLSNANTFSGGVNVGSSTANNGTIALGNDAALGTGTLTLGGSITLQSTDAVGTTRTIANPLGTFAGTSPTYTFGTATTGDLVFSSTTVAALTSGGTTVRTFAVNNANTTIRAPLSGPGASLTKTGSGNLILTGANTYSSGGPGTFGAGTTITAGTLTLGNGVATGAILPASTSLNNNSAFVENSAPTDSTAITGPVVGAGTFTKNGTGTLTLTPLATTASVASANSTSLTVATNKGLVVGASVTGAGIPAGTIITAIGATASSATTITLSIASTVASAAAVTIGNTFSGALTVNSGILIGNSGAGNASTLSLGTGSVIIGSAGILATTQPDQALLNRVTSAPLGSVIAFTTAFNGIANLNLSTNSALANVSIGALSNVTLNSTGSSFTPNNSTYRLGGGSGQLTIQGSLLTGASNSLVVAGGSVRIGSSDTTYGGSTTINSGGFLNASTNTRIKATSAFTVNTGGTLDLGNSDAGATQTVASLSGGGLITNSGTSSGLNKILAVNPTVGVSTTFSGTIVDHTSGASGSVALTKSGAGALALIGVNSFTGATTVTGGTLSAGADGALQSTASIAVNNGGTLLLANSTTNNDRVNDAAGITLGAASPASAGTIQKSAGVSEGTSASVGLGALTLATGSAGNAIDFTSTAGTLTFAYFTPNGATLTINNYVNNGSEHLVFNQDQDVSMASSLGNFAFTGYSGVDQLSLGNGFFEIVPDMTAVPEPATWFAGLGIVAMLGMSQRKRLMTNV